MRSVPIAVLMVLLTSGPLFSAGQPNLLWLTTEDIGPHLGCYGDTYAVTPNLDEFARHSIRYVNAWSNAPVCAPARTALITGMYPPSLGAEHMRSEVALPPGVQLYPQLMQQAGYFCVNPGKEDYNVTKPRNLWDSASKTDLWKDLREHQPFLAVLNHVGTHESQLRIRPHEWTHDVDRAPVPPYQPDVLEARQDWAQYYDNITRMDDWFAAQLEELRKNGLAENTIVFFYGDHGSGMPSHKRCCQNAGLSIPLIVYIPEALREMARPDAAPGEASRRLVEFVDLAPTILSLAGTELPKYLQGEAFLGAAQAPSPRYAYGFRGRMDEREDLVRTVRNDRYQYIRNYMPWLPQGQHVAYMFQTPTTRKWKELYDAGELNNAQRRFWERRPYEELYDLEADPHELVNLVDDPRHQPALEELREALDQWMLRIRDVGFIPEGDRRARAQGRSPAELGADEAKYPLERVMAAAGRAASGKEVPATETLQTLSDPDSAVRYWGVLELFNRSTPLNPECERRLQELMASDPSPNVRVVAAETLATLGDQEQLSACLKLLIDSSDSDRVDPFVALQALNSLDRMDDKALEVVDQIRAVPQTGSWSKERGADHLSRLIDHLLSELPSSSEQ